MTEPFFGVDDLFEQQDLVDGHPRPSGNFQDIEQEFRRSIGRFDNNDMSRKPLALTFFVTIIVLFL